MPHLCMDLELQVSNSTTYLMIDSRRSSGCSRSCRPRQVPVKTRQTYQVLTFKCNYQLATVM